jgi:hypothetical protein
MVPYNIGDKTFLSLFGRVRYKAAQDTSLADPHWFNADPDPDPAFWVNGNLDPGFDDQRMYKTYSRKINKNF